MDMEDRWGHCDATEGIRGGGSTLRRGEGQRENAATRQEDKRLRDALRYDGRQQAAGRHCDTGMAQGRTAPTERELKPETVRQSLMNPARSC